MLRHLYFFLKIQLLKGDSCRYFGEFGYELISVIPYAYYLHKKNKLKKTVSCPDSKSLYYFSPSHEEINRKRNFIIPNVPINNIHLRIFPKLLWEPPPYKEIYRNSEFVFSKPLLIICNKYNQEWGHPPITFFSLDMLKKIFDSLQSRYQIVYCRPTSRNITDDNSDIYELNDHDFIRKNYPEIMLIQDLHSQHPQYTFNELQLKIFANTDHFISVQGGYSILCSYFKGVNLVYGKKDGVAVADEIINNAYDGWYHFFSGAKVVYSPTYDDMNQRITELF